MNNFGNISFIDNPAIAQRASRYTTIVIDSDKVLQSWRLSLFSYQWLTPEGALKDAADLPAGEQQKRDDVETLLEIGQPLEKPVLGIGLLENVEIGVGLATFLTLVARGVKHIPVHIPLTNEEEFMPFEAATDNGARYAG